MPTNTKRKRCEDGTHCDEYNVLAKIRKSLRLVQNITGCVTKTLNLVLQHLHPFLKGVGHIKRLQMERHRTKESLVKRRLHGCASCNEYVFGPENRNTHCPKCGYPRCDESGNPHEVQFV